jgi:tRNA (mo5U34)-methyltransferase
MWLDNRAYLVNSREEIIRFGPWDVDVEGTPDVSTRVFLQAKDTDPASFVEVSFIDLRQGLGPAARFSQPAARTLSEGLAGRSVLDCARDCGGYLLLAKELGAGDCFAFGIRKHWINQARFRAKYRGEPSDGIRLEVCNLPEHELQPFYITLFNGRFYYFPDPITGLKIAADLTKELIIVTSATRNGFPDGMLAIDEEGPEERCPESTV